MQKSNRFLLRASLLILMLIVVATVGRYTWIHVYRPCDVDAVNVASQLLESQLYRFDHAYQFATSASRSALDHPVLTLQQIVIHTQEIPVPACLRSAKKELTNYMKTVVRAFQAYGAGDEDATMRELLDQSDSHYDNFTMELREVKQCAPFCIRW